MVKLSDIATEVGRSKCIPPLIARLEEKGIKVHRIEGHRMGRYGSLCVDQRNAGKVREILLVRKNPGRRTPKVTEEKELPPVSGKQNKNPHSGLLTKVEKLLSQRESFEKKISNFDKTLLQLSDLLDKLGVE